MPVRHDWSKQWRAMPFVSEYVLIGEVHFVGQLWHTFGVAEGKAMTSKRPPYEEDGFTRTELTQVSVGALGYCARILEFCFPNAMDRCCSFLLPTSSAASKTTYQGAVKVHICRSVLHEVGVRALKHRARYEEVCSTIDSS